MELMLDFNINGEILIPLESNSLFPDKKYNKEKKSKRKNRENKEKKPNFKMFTKSLTRYHYT